MTVMSRLSALESAGLIRVAQIEPDLEYLFRHSLVQDAVYASLLSSDQKRLHLAVGRAVEDIYSDRLEEFAPVLAWHFERAGKDRRALKYFVQAGDAALASCANPEAEDYYRKALDLSCSQQTRARLLAGLGESLFHQSQYHKAVAAWEEGIKLYQALDEPQGVARLYARSARAAWHAGDFARALILAESGLRAVEGAPESPELALLIHEAGRAHHFLGQPEEARPLCEKALAMARKLGAVAVEADTLATLGVLPDWTLEEAIDILGEAVDQAESAGLLEIAHRAHHNLGAMIISAAGNTESARRHFLRGAELARQRGAAQDELFSLSDAVGMSLSSGSLDEVEEGLATMDALLTAIPEPGPQLHGYYHIKASLLERQGRWVEAIGLRRSSWEEARRRGNLQAVLFAGLELAKAVVEIERLGEFKDEEAREAGLAEAMSALLDLIGKRADSMGAGATTRSLLSMVRAHQGWFKEARQLLEEAQQQPRAKSEDWEEMILGQARARLAAAQGDWATAAAAHQAVANASVRLGLRWERALALHEWAGTLLARGEPGDLYRAQELLREAGDIFHDMAAFYYQARVEEQLREVLVRTRDHASAYSKAAQELALAGRIQEGLLPRESPYLPGWQLAAMLEPARETSGDFYDFIRLENGQLGIVIADVSDKGAGAALYMTLTRTLLRTYAAAHPDDPAAALDAVNQRVLAETDTGMFATVFYGILNPETGNLEYANAGHDPPLFLRADTAQAVQALTGDGMALGIVEDARWQQQTVRIEPGDALLLYTDGAVDALNPEGEAFGRERLLATAEGHRGATARDMQEAILTSIHDFVEEAPRFDDLTLMVVARI
jgi:serine phosphatase RsbU (regulator of sigma subunit)/tetratricopeptide (TPR) repeat protein